MWRLRGKFSRKLVVLFALLVSCQQAQTDAPMINENSPIPPPTSTLPPPVVPSRIDLLTQLTIGKINQMALSPNGDYLAVAAVSGRISIGKQILNFSGQILPQAESRRSFGHRTALGLEVL